MNNYREEEIEYIQEIFNYLKKEELLNEQEITSVGEDFTNYNYKLNSDNFTFEGFSELKSAFRKEHCKVIEKFIRHNFRKVDKLLGLDKTTYFYYDVTDAGYFYFDIEEIRLQVGVALAKHPDFNGSLIDKVTSDALNYIEKYITHPEFKIREISFAENYLDNEEFKIIVDSLIKKDTNVKYIDVSKNYISNELFNQLKEEKPWITIILE